MTTALAAIDWPRFVELARKTKPKPADSWRFDTSSQRWQHGESGRPVPPARIAAVLAERQKAVQGSLAEHGRALAAGKLSPEAFTAAARAEIKAAHIQARLLAIGGRENATARDWGKVGRELRDQYARLGDFATTPDMSEAYAANRAASYGGGAVKGTYATGQRDSHAAAGFDEKRRVGPNDDATCETCGAEIARGWVPIDDDGAEIGGPDCYPNCRCAEEYRRSSDGDGE